MHICCSRSVIWLTADVIYCHISNEINFVQNKTRCINAMRQRNFKISQFDLHQIDLRSLEK